MMEEVNILTWWQIWPGCTIRPKFLFLAIKCLLDFKVIRHILPKKDLKLWFIKLVCIKHWNYSSYSNLSKLDFYFLLNIEDSCQYWLDLKSMKLTSPNYPKWYFADGIGCDWLLTAPEDHIIALEFNDFEVITIPSLYIF